jgi:hypothetical protein
VALSIYLGKPLFYLIDSEQKQPIPMINKLALVFSINVFFFTFCLAQTVSLKPLPKVEQINGLDYEVLPGLAEITSIELVKKAKESPLGYDEYQVLFRFIPMEGHELLAILKGKSLDLVLKYHRSRVRVGPAYIRKMNLRIGTRYAMKLFQTRSGGLNVERYFYESKILENQLFKVYERVIEELSLTLTFNAADTRILEKDYSQLSPAEQRALIDAELKPIVNNQASEKPFFTQASFDFLKKHSNLLDEYEAALGALAKQEELKYQERLKEAKNKKDAENVLAEKIKVIGNPAIPKVAPKAEIVRGCYYEVIPGWAEVTKIQPCLSAKESIYNYTEHQVLFKFDAHQGYDLLDKLKDEDLEFVLYHRAEKVSVGPAYIEQKGLQVGKRYPMKLYQKRDGQSCTEQYTYTSEVLDNDLFELFPRRSKLRDELEQNNEEEQDTTLEVGDNPKVKIMSYENAKKELKLAQLDKQIGIVNANRAIKLARQKARNLKKIERIKYNAEQKRLKGEPKIQLGNLEVSSKSKLKK